jgi:solute carrier family 45, member 1/2/4
MNSRDRNKTGKTTEGDHLRRSFQLSRIIARLKVPWLTLPRAWAASHILTSTVLLSTYLTHSPIQSTCLASILGISWALTQWAPLALISVSIAAQQLKQTTSSRQSFYSRINTLSDEGDGARTPTYNDHPSDEEVANGKEEILGVTGDLQAGAAMGIYNIAIAAPQIVAALGGSGIFWFLRWCGFDDTDVVGWVIRIGGLAGLVAAWLAAGIKTERYR